MVCLDNNIGFVNRLKPSTQNDHAHDLPNWFEWKIGWASTCGPNTGSEEKIIFGSGGYDSMTVDGAHHVELQPSTPFTHPQCIMCRRLLRPKCNRMRAQKVFETVTQIRFLPA